MSTDLHEVLPFNQWQTAGLEVQPDHVLISSRASDVLYEEKGHHVILKRPEIRPKSEFSAKQGMERLISIFKQEETVYDAEADVVHDARDRTRVKLRGVLDCDALLSLGTVNALLTFIQSRRLQTDLSKEEFLLQMVQSIDMFRLPSVMLLNADTFYALGIFESRAKNKLAAKLSFENATLFGLLDSCATSHGKALFRHWFLTPSTDVSILASRHDAIECFLLPQNIHLAEKVIKALRKCHDMLRAVQQLQQGYYGSSNSSVWQSILNFVLNTIKIIDFIRDMSDVGHMPLLARLCEPTAIATLETSASLINDVIDFDESEVEGRIVVKRLVDDLLDDRKDAFDGIEATLDKVETELASTLPEEYAELLRCIYIPQVGFHVIMPIEESDHASAVESSSTEAAARPPVYQDASWEAKFCSSEQWYFKNDRMTEM